MVRTKMLHLGHRVGNTAGRWIGRKAKLSGERKSQQMLCLNPVVHLFQHGVQFHIRMSFLPADHFSTSPPPMLLISERIRTEVGGLCINGECYPPRFIPSQDTPSSLQSCCSVKSSYASGRKRATGERSESAQRARI